MVIRKEDIAVNDIYLIPNLSVIHPTSIVPTRVIEVNETAFVYKSRIGQVKGAYRFRDRDQATGVIVKTSMGLEKANCLAGDEEFEKLLHGVRVEIAEAEEQRESHCRKRKRLIDEERVDFAPK